MLNNSKVFISSGSSYLLLFICICLSFPDTHTHLLHQMHSMEMKRKRNRWKRLHQMLFSHSTTTLHPSCIFLLQAAARHARLCSKSATTFIFFLFLDFDYMRFFLILLEFCSASIAKINCPRHVRKK